MAITAALGHRRTAAEPAAVKRAPVPAVSIPVPVITPEVPPRTAKPLSSRSPSTAIAKKRTATTARLNSCSDVELLERFCAGEQQAFAELYGRHKQQIYTYCVRMLGGDQDLASDAFQEVFIKVSEKASQFREGSNVTGWLFMIARNTCLNVFRGRKPNECLDDHAELESADRSLAPEFGEEQNFLRAKLEQAIAELPVDYREPLVLREFDGLGYAEIAKLTGTSLSVTKVRIYRAKQKLREILRPYVTE
jgi:RNA polymerase sigma-70 factor (ECF subfamily)